MKRTYKTEGIILKRQNIGETDRLITIFSKHYGKIKAIAKGIRKITSRRAPSLELFNHSSFVLYKGKGLDYINDATSIAVFSTLKKDLDRVSHAYMVSELLDRLLADGQEQRKIFEVVLVMLKKLDEKDASTKTVDAYMKRFKLFLLENLGFIPKDKNYSNLPVDSFIEDVIERKLQSKVIFKS